jgi:hypothetical protein
MPTDLGPLFPPNYTGIPTHMSLQDRNIWYRWHPFAWQQFSGFYFDAAVGIGTIPPPGGNEKLRAAWIRLTKKRIDAIGLRKDAIWIIEVRATAGASALGAVLTYLHLLRDDNPFSLPLAGAIITDRADDDSRRVMTAYNVTCIEV